MRRNHSGFTLLELMIVLVVVAILAAFALSSYRKQVLKSHRSDATSTLGDAQLRQERWRAENPAYGSLANINLGSASPNGYYTITLGTLSGNCPNTTPAVAAATSNSYILQAAATGAQTDDTDCTTIKLSSLCGTISRTPDVCWSK